MRAKRFGRLKKRRSFIALGMLILMVGMGMLPGSMDFTWPPKDGQVMAASFEDGVEPLGSIDGEDAGRAEMSDTVLTEDAAVKSRQDILIVLDPGHGGEDEGCSYQDVFEKRINLAIAKMALEELKELGYEVELTRYYDTTVTLEERVSLANESGADLYISIHQNACEEKTADVSGMEVWFHPQKAAGGSERLAKLIYKDVLADTRAKGREVIADETLYVIRETNMPSCLIETGFLTNKKERELLVSEEYQNKIARGIASAVDHYFYPKTMYLTFDDGPSAENTTKILDILKKRNIKATFFLVGENVEKHPDVAKRIVEEGHTIGIHCYNHDYERIYQDVDSFVNDFEKAKQAVLEATGVEAQIFRFPGGSINSYNKEVYRDIIEEMTDRGYIYYDWNASLEDATKHNDPEILIRNANESTFGRRKVVMLAHDVVYQTTLCLDELIDQFPEYQFLPITEEVNPIQF